MTFFGHRRGDQVFLNIFSVHRIPWREMDHLMLRFTWDLAFDLFLSLPLPLKPPSVVHPPTQIQQLTSGSSHCGSAAMNLTSIHGDASLIPGLAQWSKDPALPWMWVADVVWILCSWLAAAAPIWPPAWELPYSTCAALKSNKKQMNNNQKNFTSALMLPMLSPLGLYIWPLPFDAEDAGLYIGVLQLLQAHVLA